MDLRHRAEDVAYITEQHIDNFLIANHEDEEGEKERTLVMRQKMDATTEMIRASYARKGFSHVPLRPRTPVPVSTPPEQRDWDFFYRSLQVALDMRTTKLAKTGVAPLERLCLPVRGSSACADGGLVAACS